MFMNMIADRSIFHVDSSDSESNVTNVSKTTCSANDPESSTSVSMESRHAAIFTDDGDTSSPFTQGVKKRKVDHNSDLYGVSNFWKVFYKLT